jgi:hypothetical protein
MRFGLALAVLLAFLYATHWGETLRDMSWRSWVAYKTGRQLSLERRRALLLDDTYPVLLEVNKRTPPDAVILFPPKELFRKNRDFIPLTAMASSTYSFIYPRVPVHYGDGAPYRDRVTHVLNYNHWALRQFWPDVQRTDANRYGVLPWRGEAEIP